MDFAERGESVQLAVPMDDAARPVETLELARGAQPRLLELGSRARWQSRTDFDAAFAGAERGVHDVVVTARHVVAPPAAMKQAAAFPVVVRGESEVMNIDAVIVANETADTAILRVSAKDLTPLALSHDVQVGDTAYCFSDPRDVLGHFSSGLVNRFHSTVSQSSPLQQRMDVSADWAPGSSGSAILDEHGNVIGHVARIRPLFGTTSRTAEPAAKSAAPTLMTLNEAVPAAVVLSLIDKGPAR